MMMSKDNKLVMICPKCHTPLERTIDWSIYKFSIKEAGVYMFACGCFDKSITITIVSK